MLRSTEANILATSRELRSVVVESGEMAESLFERVNDGYRHGIYYGVFESNRD